MGIAIYPGDSILLPIREQFPCSARQFLHPRLPSCGTVWPHSWEAAPTTTHWQKLCGRTSHKCPWMISIAFPSWSSFRERRLGRKGGSHGTPATLPAQPVYKEVSTREIWRRESYPDECSDALGIPLHCLATNPTGNALWLWHALQLGHKSILACFENLIFSWYLALRQPFGKI